MTLKRNQDGYSDICHLSPFDFNDPAFHDTTTSLICQNLGKGVVYFAHAPEVRRIKVGHTSQASAQWRINQMHLYSAVEIMLMMCVPGNVRMERALHARHKGSRFRGEWFNETPGLWADIEAGKALAVTLDEMPASRYLDREILAVQQSGVSADQLAREAGIKPHLASRLLEPQYWRAGWQAMDAARKWASSRKPHTGAAA